MSTSSAPPSLSSACKAPALAPAPGLGGTPDKPPTLTPTPNTYIPGPTNIAMRDSIFPNLYSFPPFFSRQPNPTTYSHQRSTWSSFILSYYKHKRIYRLNISDALASELFWNKNLNKRLSARDAVEILDFMASPAGGGHVEWWSGSGSGSGSAANGEPSKTLAIIYWKKPEEWANLIYDWIDSTGQRGSVLTLYKITDGDLTVNQEFHGLDPYILRKALKVLIKRGTAQIFSIGEESGVKFF